MSARPRRRVESHARLAWRVTEALTRDELTRDEYLTLTYLISKISHDVWMRPPEDQALVTELAVIKAETSWTVSTRRIQQVLEALNDKGWIGTNSRIGSKKWEIRLSGAVIREEEDRKETKDGVQDFEVSSKPAETSTAANPDRQTETDAPEPRNADDRLDIDVDVDVHEHESQKHPPQEVPPRTDGATHALAAQVLAKFNEIAGTEYDHPNWINKIAATVRSHPNLTLEDHAAIIRTALSNDVSWWLGELNPSFVYGGAQFETMLHAAGRAPQQPGLAPAEADPVEPDPQGTP